MRRRSATAARKGAVPRASLPDPPTMPQLAALVQRAARPACRFHRDRIVGRQSDRLRAGVSAPTMERGVRDMPRRSCRLAFCFALAVLAAPAFAEAGKPPPTAATIDGFRDAHFGMTEAELRRAIQADFPKAAVAVAINPTEKTTILSLTAGGLLPDTGPARVSYILGYRSRR